MYLIKEDVKYIVLGTNHFWFGNVYEITESIHDNQNDLNDAAQEITELFRPSNSERDRGVIVIAMEYPSKRCILKYIRTQHNLKFNR